MLRVSLGGFQNDGHSPLQVVALTTRPDYYYIHFWSSQSLFSKKAKSTKLKFKTAEHFGTNSPVFNEVSNNIALDLAVSVSCAPIECDSSYVQKCSDQLCA